MGNCCGGGEPTCQLDENSKMAISQIANESVHQKSSLPFTAPYVGKCVIAKTGCPFNQLAQKVMKDMIPVDSYRVDGVPPIQAPQGASIPQEPMSRIVTGVASDVNRQVQALLLTAAVNSVKGGNAQDQKAKERCAQTALLKAAQQAVGSEVAKILRDHQRDIEQYAKEPSPERMALNATANMNNSSTNNGGPSMSGNAASRRGEPPQSFASSPHPPPKNNNNNSNNGGAAAAAPQPPGDYYGQQQQQQNQNHQQPPPINTNIDPQNYQNQQHGTPLRNPEQVSKSYEEYQQTMSQYSEVAQAAQDTDDVASPTNEAWSRYPLPEENGPWVPINEAFYYSEACGLYYFPAAGHFFDPNSGYWHNPDTDEWITEEDHEVLLEKMAEEGLY